VAYQGTVTWHSKSPPEGSGINIGIGDDDDYSLSIARPDASLYTTTSKQNLLLELDSDETIDHFRTPWWAAFHKAVDSASDWANKDGNNPNARQHLRDKKAIVIGLLGLDCAGEDVAGQEHHCGVEIHPVFGGAVDVDETPTANKWTFFMRNVGNEGYCAPSDNKDKPKLLGTVTPSGRIYKIVLPSPSPSDDFAVDPHFARVSVGPLDEVRYWHDGRSDPVTNDRCRADFVPGKGVVLTFVLPAPESQASGDYVIEGQVLVSWAP
jgi:hypothetical protein